MGNDSKWHQSEGREWHSGLVSIGNDVGVIDQVNPAQVRPRDASASRIPTVDEAAVKLGYQRLTESGRIHGPGKHKSVTTNNPNQMEIRQPPGQRHSIIEILAKIDFFGRISQPLQIASFAVPIASPGITIDIQCVQDNSRATARLLSTQNVGIIPQALGAEVNHIEVLPRISPASTISRTTPSRSGSTIEISETG